MTQNKISYLWRDIEPNNPSDDDTDCVDAEPGEVVLSASEEMQKKDKWKETERPGEYRDFLSSAVTYSKLMNTTILSFLLFFLVFTIPIGIVSLVRLIKTGRIKLIYEMDGESQRKFDACIVGCNGLKHSRNFKETTSWWHIDPYASKTHGGATRVVKTAPVWAGLSSLDIMCSKNKFPCLKLQGRTLYFLPDKLLISKTTGLRTTHTMYDYSALSIVVAPSHVIERGSVRSTEVVDRVWEKVNKDGSPDRRFSSNRLLPICLYGEMMIRVGPEFFMLLQCSDYNAATNFTNGWASLIIDTEFRKYDLTIEQIVQKR